MSCFLSLCSVFQASSVGCVAHGAVVEREAFHETECSQLGSAWKIEFLSDFGWVFPNILRAVNSSEDEFQLPVVQQRCF